MKSITPYSRATFSSFCVPYPVIMIMGVFGSIFLISLRVSIPERLGMFKSRMMESISRSLITLRASSPFEAVHIS